MPPSRRIADGTISANGQTNEIAISMWLLGNDARAGTSASLTTA